MTNIKSTRFRSRWDWSTWLIIGLVALCCISPYFLGDDGIAPIVVSAAMLLFVIVIFLSVSYEIRGHQLIVYTFFIPKSYPIDDIVSVGPTNNVLSAPATSLTRRIAIRFKGKGEIIGSHELIISPVRTREFIDRLKSINPAIEISE